MKNLILLPLFFLIVGVFIGCDNESGGLVPYLEIAIYDGNQNVCKTIRVPLPNDTVWLEDSLINESGDTIYFDVVDTIYRAEVDSFLIPYSEDTMKFSIKTNCSWELEISQVKWDTVMNNGVVSPAPIDWFTRPKTITGGGNGSVELLVTLNKKDHNRGVILDFLTKNPNVKCRFLLTQEGKPKE